MNFEKLAEGLVAFRKEAKVPRYVRNILESGRSTRSFSPELRKVIETHRKYRDFGREYGEAIGQARASVAREQKAAKNYKAVMQKGTIEQKLKAMKELVAATDAVKPAPRPDLLEMRKLRKARAPKNTWIRDQNEAKAKMDRVNRYVTRGRGLKGKARKAAYKLFPGARVRKEEAVREKLVRAGKLPERFNNERAFFDRVALENRRTLSLLGLAAGGTAAATGYGGYRGYRALRKRKK